MNIQLKDTRLNAEKVPISLLRQKSITEKFSQIHLLSRMI